MSNFAPTVLLSVLIAIVLACGSDPEPTPVPPTATLVPTNTPAPTNTPIPPTATPVPTNTPLPTNTPIPPTGTPVPVPTATPAPTNTPEPATTPQDDRPPSEILADAIRGLAELDSFHLFTELVISMAQGSGGTSIQFPITLQADFQKPFDSAGSINMDIGFFSIEMQFVTVDGEAYITDPETGEWMLGASASDLLPLKPVRFRRRQQPHRP